MIDPDSAVALRYGLPSIPVSRLLDALIREVINWDRGWGDACLLCPEECTRWGACPLGGGGCVITVCDPWGINLSISYTGEDCEIGLDLARHGVLLDEGELPPRHVGGYSRRLRRGILRSWAVARRTLETMV